MAQTRRAFLMSGVTVGAIALTGCVAGTTARPGAPNTSSVPVSLSSGSPATPNRQFGVRRDDFRASGGSVTVASAGPKGVVIAAGGQYTAYVTDWPDSLAILSPTPANEKEVSSVVGIEQTEDGLTTVLYAGLANKAGSGLAASSTVLHASFQRAEGAPKTCTIEVSWTTAELVAATICNGVALVVAVAHDGSGSNFGVAFDQEGKVLWTSESVSDIANRTEYHHPMAWGNRNGQFIVCGDAVAKGFDAMTGRVVWQITQPNGGSGAIMANSTVFSMAVYTSGGYGDGIRLYSSGDGALIGQGAPRDAVYDPIAGEIVMAFTTTSQTGSNLPGDDGSSPALSVLVAEGGRTSFTLARDAAASLGQIDAVSAFDGRMVVSVQDGLRVVKSSSGAAEEGFESLAPNSAIDNIPISSSRYWALSESGRASSAHNGGVLDRTIVNGTGFKGIVYSDSALRWADLNVSAGS